MDVSHVLDFIDYVFDQEVEEYKYIRSRAKRKPSVMTWFAKMAQVQPLCYKLVVSVTDRINALGRTGILARQKGLSVQTINRHQRLVDAIFRAIRRGELYPQIARPLRYGWKLDVKRNR